MPTRCRCLFLVALFLSGCQDYLFEAVHPNTYEIGHPIECVPVNSEVDILFIVDNSHSMAGEQLQLALSFKEFATELNDYFDEDKYRIAIVSTGMESFGCGQCDEIIISGCLNESGENGRFQNRLGHITWIDNRPVFDFVTDDACRIITDRNLECFFDEATDRGAVLVGINGCGFERGLEAMRTALSEDLLLHFNSGFFREDAILAVIVVSDEEDCGKVGEVSEDLPYARAWTCYYAAKGIGPDGSSAHPEDPQQRQYQLTPVEEYYQFLLDLKGGQKSMLKFAAIVGMRDPENPSTTTIDYLSDDPSAEVAPACVTPNCQGDYCVAYPGTRYIKMAQMFGNLGFVDTICQDNFFETMAKLGGLITCPSVFTLDKEIFDSDLVALLLNGEPIPRYTCDDSMAACSGGADEICAPGECKETWTYLPPSDSGGKPKIVINEHYNPCKLAQGSTACIELFYVPE